MMRLAAVVLVALVAALPLTVMPSAPITWLAAGALAVGGAGALALSVPLVTAGGSLAVIGHALALVIAKPAADPVPAIALGVALVALLALVHFAGRVRGAAIGSSVIASELRRWLMIVAVGVVAAVVLSAGAAGLAAALRGAALPVVVAAAALGAVMTSAGVISLLASGGEPPAPADE